MLISGGTPQAMPSSFTYSDIILSDSAQLATSVCGVVFSSTITFTASSCSDFTLTLTGNVTSSTATGAIAGQQISLSLCQDATGSRTFAWPPNFIRPPTISPTASSCTNLTLFYDGVNWRQTGATGDTLTPTAGGISGTWAGNPTWTGNHTFSGNNLFTGNNSFTQLSSCQYVNASQSFATALGLVGTSGCIQVSPGNYPVLTNSTVPAGVSMYFSEGGALTINNLVTLAINGPITAPTTSQIFFYSGSGVVTLGAPSYDVMATWFPGADIGVQCQNAVNAFDTGTTAFGILVIPPGLYVTSNTCTLPLYNTGKVVLDKYGSAISYTGSGYFVDTKEVSGSPVASLLVIEGGTVTGTSSGKGGIHLLPQNGITVRDEFIQNFSNGDGIALEGNILPNLFDNQFLGNKYGLHAYGTKCQTSTPFTCGVAPGGTTLTYTPNGIHSIGNIFGNSLAWGAFLDTSILGHAFQILNPVFMGNDFEANNGAAGAGGIYAQATVGLALTNNYFEANLAHNVQLGIAGGTNQGATITGNWFTNTASIPYNIELINATFPTIQGNNEGGNTTSTCFVNQSITANTLYMGINNLFSASPLCVGGSPAVPTGLLGFNQNSGARLNTFQANGYFMPNLGVNAGMTSDGSNSLQVIGGTSGWKIANNAASTTFLSGDNSGNITFTNMATGGVTTSMSNSTRFTNGSSGFNTPNNSLSIGWNGTGCGAAGCYWDNVWTANTSFAHTWFAMNQAGNAYITLGGWLQNSIWQNGTLTVAGLPAAAAGNKGQMVSVSDSTAVAAEGQTCVGGSTNTALAFSNGTVWKCF